MSRVSRRGHAVIALGCALVVPGALDCAPAPEPAAPRQASVRVEPPPEQAPVPSFRFATVDGGLVTSAALRGRMTVVALVATYDDASQALARFVQVLYRRHKPRINAVLLVLDPPENRPLMEAFRDALGITFPVALADDATRAGSGPLVGLHHVPSVVILDRHGVERWRQLGLVDARKLGAMVDELDDEAR